MSTDAQRNEIRDRIRKVRSAQTKIQRETRSAAIAERLRSLPEFQTAQTIGFYSSTHGEAKTEDMIDSALMKGKMVSLPKVSPQPPKITFYKIRSRESMKPGEYGIFEPIGDEESVVSGDEMDIIIVPGIAFDPKCDRLGYGRGYYDSFLKDVRALRVGLAFDFQIVPEVIWLRRDVRMDLVVTESQLFRCKNEGVGKDLTFGRTQQRERYAS